MSTQSIVRPDPREFFTTEEIAGIPYRIRLSWSDVEGKYLETEMRPLVRPGRPPTPREPVDLAPQRRTYY